MSYSQRSLQRIARNITAELEDSLIRCGIFYRIFYRCKSEASLESKLAALNKDGTKKYDGSNKTLRDLIGIRINLYFLDDLELITNYFKNKYASVFKEETIDLKQTTEFKPSRINLIFGLPSEAEKEFVDIVSDNRVDATFELQIRTVFSEGWHEVEHDLRYKCAEDWESHDLLARTFNGILASLETQEWAMLKIMDELSYKHYKSNNLSALIRTKLRIRTSDYQLSEKVASLIDDEFAKSLFKLDRHSVMKFLLSSSLRIPLKMDNLVFLVNYLFIKNMEIKSATPSTLLKEFKGENGEMSAIRDNS